MSDDATPAKVRLNDGLGPLPTSAEDDAVVLARLSKTPAEAYERGYMDGAARERERICAAIKAEDDYMVDRDYMLDSDDCIKVARGLWVRPE